MSMLTVRHDLLPGGVFFSSVFFLLRFNPVTNNDLLLKIKSFFCKFCEVLFRKGRKMRRKGRSGC